MNSRRINPRVQTVYWEQSRIPLLYPALQKGVLVRVRVGRDIRSLLADQLGLDPDYVERRIQTVFLDGKAVDDFETAIVEEGAVLTLSGALPGLAGATLRKGGFYSSMRDSVSYKRETGESKGKEGFITMRVFNILLPELAPVLLTHGIFFPKWEFVSFLDELEATGRTAGLRKPATKEILSQPGTGGNLETGDADWVEVRTGELKK